MDIPHHEMGIEVNIDNMNLKPQQVHDKALMEPALKFTTKPTELKAINRVRLLHKVIHLSDITTANRSRIDPAFLISDPFPERKIKYSWPKKHHVTPSDFTTWRRFINHIYSYDQFSLQRGSLLHWIQPTTPTKRISWRWFLDNTNNVLYERVNNEFALYCPRSRRDISFLYDCTTLPHLPENVLLASANLAEEHIQLLNTNINCYETPPTEPPNPPIYKRSYH